MGIDFLKGKTIMVTGATGVIGKALVMRLLTETNTNVVALVRNEEKAKRVLPISDARMHLYVGDIREFDMNKIVEHIDYIVHAASMTSSRKFVEEPVETSLISVEGIVKILEYASEKSVNKVVYLSSMEVYGTPQTDEKIDENHCSNIDTMVTRSSYSESKRMCESLCRSYWSEKNVPAVVLRLTQTFGPGVEYNDDRVFAEFARCAIEGRNIVLKTKGETKRNYLHVKDAVDAVICALINGKNGEAYNVANEETYCSIYEMAELVASRLAKKPIDVVIDEEDISKTGYASLLKMNLDTRKIQSIGWKPEHDLYEMYEDMICEMESENNA